LEESKWKLNIVKEFMAKRGKIIKTEKNGWEENLRETEQHFDVPHFCMNRHNGPTQPDAGNLQIITVNLYVRCFRQIPLVTEICHLVGARLNS